MRILRSDTNLSALNFFPMSLLLAVLYLLRSVVRQYAVAIQCPCEHRAVGNSVGALKGTAVKISKLDKPVEVRRVQRFIVRNGFLKIPPDVPIGKSAYYCEGRGKPVNCVLFLLCKSGKQFSQNYLGTATCIEDYPVDAPIFHVSVYCVATRRWLQINTSLSRIWYCHPAQRQYRVQKPSAPFPAPYRP